MKEYYAGLEKLIDDMLEKSVTDAEYQAMEKQLTDHIRNYYVKKEQMKREKIEKTRTAALNKVVEGIVEYLNTYDGINIDSSALKELTAAAAEESLKEIAKEAQYLQKLGVFDVDPVEEQKNPNLKNTGDVLKDYIASLRG